MKEKIIMEDIYVMYSEPAADLIFEKARHQITQIKTEADLAMSIAIIGNKAWWRAHEADDYDECDGEYKQVIEETELWFSLYHNLCLKVFKILTKEGVMIPKTGRISVLELFMKRYGYCNYNGWWIEEKLDG